jgi:hypothetical protein
MKTMNEVIFEKLVNEYNRRVSAGMSRDYRQRAWKVVLTAYKENQYEPWMRKFTIREADKIIYKVHRGRPNYTKQYIDWKVKEVLGSACYLLHIFFVETGEFYASKIGTSEQPQERFQQEITEYEKLTGRKVRIEVKMCEPCHNLPATIACESRMRAFYIDKYEDAFQMNDRFVGVVIDPKEAKRIAKPY